MLQLVLSIVMTVGFAVSIVLSGTKARGVLILSVVGVVIGLYWTVQAWREWRGQRRGARRGQGV